MKQTKLFKGLLVVVLLLSSLYANAYSFSATNSDGVTIYYDIVSSSDHTCEVVYKDRYTRVYSGDIVIPETVKRSGTTYTVVGIGEYAFFASFYSLTSVVIPNSVTYIDYMAFSDCYNLTSIKLGTSVEIIGELAFRDCSGLTSIDIPDSVITIDDGAFEDCTGLTSVDIPNSVTTIGDWAFYECTGLTSVVIPNSVQYLSGFIFCTSLTEITIPDGVATIGWEAFKGCTGLTGELKIPDSVTTIGVEAFEGCMGLTSLTLGNSVTTIGAYAFRECTGLTSIYSLNPEPPICRTDVFYNVPTTICTLYVPIGSHDAYATAYQWKDFNIVEMDMTGIESVIASSEDIEVVGYYTIDGKAVDAPQKGVNIVKYSDGTTKKVLVK